MTPYRDRVTPPSKQPPLWFLVGLLLIAGAFLVAVMSFVVEALQSVHV